MISLLFVLKQLRNMRKRNIAKSRDRMSDCDTGHTSTTPRRMGLHLLSAWWHRGAQVHRTVAKSQRCYAASARRWQQLNPQVEGSSWRLHRYGESAEDADTVFTLYSRLYTNRLYEHSRLYNRLGELCKWAQPSGAWAVQPGRLRRHIDAQQGGCVDS